MNLKKERVTCFLIVEPSVLSNTCTETKITGETNTDSIAVLLQYHFSSTQIPNYQNNTHILLDTQEYHFVIP